MREERFSFFCQPLAKKQKICYNKENSQCSILNLSQEEQKMIKVLCILLITVCVLALGSCEQLEKLMSFLPTTQSSTTTPEANNAEIKNPTNDNVDETTYDNNHSCTTPEPNEEGTKVPEGNGETIVVEVKFQSGGVHAYHDKITVTTPATFTQVLGLFLQMHEDLSSYSINFHLNGVRVDPNDTTFLKNGDYIYLEESGDGSGDQYPCNHNWVDGSCMLCGMPCPHSEWDDNRQCLLCGTSLGVDLLQIDIYENGEYKYNAGGCIETTVENLLMAYYGPYPWEYWTSGNDIYFNDILITDSSYMIRENGILNIVSRSN